jgi:energy-coupling factor transporter ATP-binding protein EcfA2
MGAAGRVHAADSHRLIRVHRARVKLAIQMATDGGIYVLDEPTSGLHLAEYVGTGASTVDRRS